MDYKEVKSIIEGLLFMAGSEGLEARQIAEVIGTDADEAADLCHDLAADYRRDGRGLQIVEVAGVFQMTTLPEHAPYFEKLAYQPQQSTLSQAALETLSIIAYKQPITRSDIEEIRGVKSEKAINNLLGKKLIAEVGRAEGPGRPILFGTTREFLEYFGLRDLSELPPPPAFIPQDAFSEEERLLFDQRSIFSFEQGGEEDD
ncbi:SMC-Scp complex subunit ScpB [Effusibacillus lacus]|uniref:Segregation and condensation protein B n=1 Tax=Effusibacillus lacus TaxID=1348429 RepID=A0A292YSU9_9BACL|nr:SMC-Scp complex subunit ScpB [Effusibacillus lacus]TCS76295.1 segregation and condensation protein B [Effusibacillus lacus]GAX91843.1 SMC-Scp complex subunit ScpB [Effusibacillus lacus]